MHVLHTYVQSPVELLAPLLHTHKDTRLSTFILLLLDTAIYVIIRDMKSLLYSCYLPSQPQGTMCAGYSVCRVQCEYVSLNKSSERLYCWFVELVSTMNNLDIHPFNISGLLNSPHHSIQNARTYTPHPCLANCTYMHQMLRNAVFRF